MKSEILVKATAELDAKVQAEINSEDKSIAEILEDDELQPGGVSRSDSEDNGEDKKEV